VVQSSKQILFNWEEPFDNGGYDIVEFEIQIEKVDGNEVFTKTIINSNEFDFVAEEGMLPGYEYHIKLRAKNFYTHYYSLGDLSPWSAVSIFYSSDLPQTVSELTFTDRTKTGAIIHWEHLQSEKEKGYSTIELFYQLWVDDCNGSPIKYLVVNSTSILEYEITNIPPGQTCRFRMNTINIIGTSLKYTPTLSVLMAAIPDRPPRPEYVARSGGDFRTGEKASITIQWEAPYDKGGIPILGYYVRMAENSGEFQLAYDGSVEPEILSY
jgi:UDP:flavonoid glycosyltransferase YjiC (YdhE family)